MISDATVVDVSRDWLIACDVQQRFMQGYMPKAGALDFSARCRQMQALGGDCYDFVPLGDRRLALTVGDASGHGLPAALLIANVQSSLRTAALFSGSDLAATLAAVNRHVYSSSLANSFATLFHANYDAGTRRLNYVNAGHNPPLVIHPDGSALWLEASGTPVGIFPELRYQETEVQLNPGDLLVAYTDGVVEATSPCGEDWGVERLRVAAGGCGGLTADEIVQTIFAAMDAFSEGCQRDDATVLVLRVNGCGHLEA